MAHTHTTNYDLYKPEKDEQDWDDDVNTNFDTIDTQLKTNADIGTTNAAAIVSEVATARAAEATKAAKGANSDITSLSGLTTPLSVAQGGTGAATLADGGIVIGNTTGAVEVVAAGTTTQILVGGGAATKPAWGTDIPTAVTIGSAYIYRAGGTDVPVTDGGTGSSSTTYCNLTTNVTGTLPVGNGGTGATAAANAANGVVVLNGSTQLPAVDGSLLTGISGGTPTIFSTFGGDGSDGSKTISADANFSDHDSAQIGVAQYTSLTINSTKTLTIDTQYAYIGVSGTLTVAGTISANGQGRAGGTTPGATAGGAGENALGTASKTALAGCVFGAGAAGGVGSAGNGGDGGGAGGAGGTGDAGVGDNGTATASFKMYRLTGGAGTDAGSTTLAMYNLSSAEFLGAGGGGGGAQILWQGVSGGAGGGLIYIECDTLNCTGTISANGANGVDGGGGSDQGGGGGGGGGFILIRCKTLTSLGTVTVTGGTGGIQGTGAGPHEEGGNGALGWKDVIVV